MKTNRFSRPVAVAAGLLFLFAVPWPARSQSASPGEPQTPMAALPGPQPQMDSLAEAFAGLKYTDDQKVEIDKIHRDAETRKAAVSKDEKLTQDQKDAMLLGYTHLEYSSIFKTLTPEQRRQVRDKIRARKAADQPAQKEQAPQS